MDFQFENYIGYWIRLIYRGMTNSHDQRLSKYGLTTSQFGVLVNLWKRDGVTQKELQEKLEIRPATLTGIIDGLVSRGYVKRECDNCDARFKRLYITDKGKSIKTECLSIVQEMEKMLVRNLTEDEVEYLNSILRKIHVNIE